MRPLSLGATVLFLFGGCAEPSASDPTGLGASEASQVPLLYVMVNKKQCDLQGDHRETAVEDITGIWVDSLLWRNRPPDTCWYGVKCLDRHIRFELKSSKAFIWKETYTDPTHDRTDKGEYFLSNDSSSTTLMIARNSTLDTLFAQGDTMRGRNFELFWNGKDGLLLVPPKSEMAENDYEVYDMVRLTPR